MWRIEDCAFWRCNALSSFRIPKSVLYIGESVFSNSEKLAGIVVDAGNPNFKSVDGSLLDITGKLLKQYPCGKSGTRYILPVGVTVIGGGAFRGANGLTEVILGDHVGEIGSTAFAFCESLKDVYFLGAMPSFGGDVFQNTAEGFTVHYYKGNEHSWQAYGDSIKKAFCYITFFSGGGSEVTAQMADYGGKAAEPTAPSKGRLEFAGWYKEAALENAWNFDTDTVAADTTLYAKWTSGGACTIKAGVNSARSGKVNGVGSYKDTDTVQLSAIPSDGYYFVKWTEGGKTVSRDAVYTFDAERSRTIKAYFEKNRRPPDHIGLPCRFRQRKNNMVFGYRRVKLQRLSRGLQIRCIRKNCNSGDGRIYRSRVDGRQKLLLQSASQLHRSRNNRLRELVFCKKRDGAASHRFRSCRRSRAERRRI